MIVKIFLREKKLEKITLPFLETMITQSCNLYCLGCTNYSDIPHKGYVSWNDGKKQIEEWIDKINIPDFGIMGGEPLINPEWKNWVIGVRELMPKSQIRFTTNGLLLNKHPDIVDFFESIGNVVFKITVHIDDKSLENNINKILDKKSWKSVTEFGIQRYKTNNNLRFQVNRPNKFIKTYKNSYSNMEPYHSDPKKAFKSCIQKTCPLLYNGRIYKCSTAGLLKDTLARFNYPNWNQWQQYITNGIGPNDSLETIKEFVENFGKHSSICSQCPTTANLNHYSNVTKSYRK